MKIENENCKKYVFRGGGFKCITTVFEREDCVELVWEQNHETIPNPIPSVVKAYEEYCKTIADPLAKYNHTDIPLISTIIIKGEVVFRYRIDGNLNNEDKRPMFSAIVYSEEEARSLMDFLHLVTNHKGER